MKLEKILKIESELVELKSRARTSGYKNGIPKLPENYQDSSMIGFYKRLSNWKKGLIVAENPNGLLRAEDEVIKNEEFITSTASLAEHFNAQ